MRPTRSCAGPHLLRRGIRPPQPLIRAFIDAQVVEGFAVESICTVLTSEGCQVAAVDDRDHGGGLWLASVRNGPTTGPYSSSAKLTSSTRPAASSSP